MSYVGQVFAKANPVYKSRLIKAKRMEKAGMSTEDIRKATDWFKSSYDQQWRMEISDSIDFSALVFQAQDDHRLRLLVYTGFSYIKDVVNNKNFLAAYPNIAAMEVRVIHAPTLHEEAEYTPAKNLIFAQAASIDALIPCLVHEIQHAIQVEEGFARGGLPDFFKHDSKGRYRPATERHGDYWLLAGEIEARDSEARTLYTPAERKSIPPMSSEDHPIEAVHIFYGD